MNSIISNFSNPHKWGEAAGTIGTAVGGLVFAHNVDRFFNKDQSMLLSAVGIPLGLCAVVASDNVYVKAFGMGLTAYSTVKVIRKAFEGMSGLSGSGEANTAKEIGLMVFPAMAGTSDEPTTTHVSQEMHNSFEPAFQESYSGMPEQVDAFAQAAA
jgi:hypothetical protein